MLIFPGSKINLGLRILGKRGDGFHDIQSTFYPLSLSDILEIIPSDDLEFTQSGESIPGNSEDNIVMKAHQLLCEKHDIGSVKIHLHKIVPTGAGIGGGSANGSAALKLMNCVFTLGLNANVLREYALELGSDCPFFIDKVPSKVYGRGEKLEISLLDLSDYYIKLIYPNLHISTAESFTKIEPSKSAEIQEVDWSMPQSWKDSLTNDFEKSTFISNPNLKIVKQKLYDEGAVFASMSGSGSGIYGLFKDNPPKSFHNYFEWISKL